MVPFNRHILKVEALVQDVDNSDKESYQVDISQLAVPADVQPANGEDTVLAEGVYGKTYNIFTTISGIIVGNRVTVMNTTMSGLIMNIVGRKDYNSGFVPHYELLAVEVN